MEDQKQIPPSHIEIHKESSAKSAKKIVQNGNLEEEIFGIINEAFNVEPIKIRTYEEGTNTASDSELTTRTLTDHADSCNTSSNATFVETTNHDGNTNSSSIDLAESRNSNVSTEDEISESKSKENDVIKEKVANKKTIVYRVDERPPFFQSFLLGFQVSISNFIFNLFGGLIFPSL